MLGVLSLPLLTYAQGYFGPIVPAVYDDNGNLQTCAAGWEAVVIVLAGLVKFAVSFGIVIAVLIIVYAGFMFMLSATNPENLSKAKKIITNAVVGLLIALSAWLLVNTLLLALGYSGGVTGATSILGGSGNICIPVEYYAASENGGGLETGWTPSIPPSGPGACDPATVRAAAVAGGYADVTDAEVNTFACLAGPESSCGANTGGATTPDGRRTSAAGAWQNLLGYSDRCHSLNIPACGNLQCSNAFRNGRVKPDAGSQQLAQRCYNAISDLKCAAAAAICLNRANGGRFRDWTADPRSSKQQKCIRDHAGF